MEWGSCTSEHPKEACKEKGSLESAGRGDLKGEVRIGAVVVVGVTAEEVKNIEATRFCLEARARGKEDLAAEILLSSDRQISLLEEQTL